MKYLWIVMILLPILIWAISAIIDIFNCLKQWYYKNTEPELDWTQIAPVEKGRKLKKFKDMTPLRNVFDYDIKESTGAFLITMAFIIVAGLFIISFGMFCEGCG